LQGKEELNVVKLGARDFFTRGYVVPHLAKNPLDRRP